MIPVFYFTTVLPGDRAFRLEAVVAWRRAPGERRFLWGPLGGLRRLRHRLWLHFGPLGIDLHIRGMERARGVVGYVGDGERTIYHEEGRAVRLLGRVYSIRQGEGTMVLLVDETRRSFLTPRVVRRRLHTRAFPLPPMPPMPPLPPEPSPPPEIVWLGRGEPPPATSVTTFIIGGSDPEWEAAIRADPEVRAFLDADGA